MIAAVVSRQYLRGTVRVTRSSIEIDDSIQLAAAANTGVHLLPYLFFFRTVKAVEIRVAEKSVLEGRYRAADGADSVLMSKGNELPIAGDQIPRSHTWCCGHKRSRKQYVIHAKTQNHVLDAGLRKHIALEALHAGIAQRLAELVEDRSQRWRPTRLVRASTIPQQAIANNPFIQDSEFGVSVFL